MTCRRLLMLSVLLAACVDVDDDDDTFRDTGTDGVDGTDSDPDTGVDATLCERASRGAISNYTVGNTVDEAPIVDLDGRAASIATGGFSGFVGFEPLQAGGFTFGRSLDDRLQVIDLFGRQPEFVEDVRDTGCVEVQVRSTYILEAEQYWLLLDGGIPFITMVGEPVDVPAE